MTDTEIESQTGPDKQPSASDESRERRRRKIVAAGFFLFFIVLWLLIHFFGKALASTGVAGGERPQFKVVEIPPGSAMSDIADILARRRIISSELAFKVVVTALHATRDLKAGEYRFNTSMTLMEILSWLRQGRVMLHEFTIPEGYTIRQVSESLEKKGLADGEELFSLAEDREFCEELGVDGPTLEGFLFPDTYRIAKGLSEKRIIRIMVDRFWNVYSNVIRADENAADMKIRDIVTIASIIEKEAIYDDEKPLIASVIYNRLKNNMPLQCDVTIRYPLDNYGKHLTYADLKLDSPYNSYLYRGLPPTPICNPGVSAMKAAVSHPETDYLYFVSMNRGRHKFSSSLKEHNRAVYRYQILNEEG